MADIPRSSPTGLGAGAGTRFGSGWISGVLGIVFSALAGGGVLCLLFPSWLTTPDARPLYPLDVVRFLIYAFLVAGFGLGTLSVLLRRSKVLGVSALALATVTTLLGGSTTKVGYAGRRSPRLRRSRLVPAQRARAVADLHSDGASVRPAARPADLSLRLAHRPHALRDEPPAAAGHRAAHAGAGHGAVRVGGVAGAAAGGAEPAADRSSSSRSSWSPTWPSTWCTVRSTACPGCGGFTPSIIRPRPWTGWPAPACICSTSSSRAGSRSCRSTCWGSRLPRSTRTWCSSRSTRCSSTPTSASASSRSSGWW